MSPQRPFFVRHARWLVRVVLVVAAVLLTGLALVINGPGVVAVWYEARYAPVVAALPAAPPVKAGDRVLVLSPHPDDDVLCCAGSIRQAVARGASVSIVYLTNGDGFELDAVLIERHLRTGPDRALALGRRRVGEARAAARLLGVPAAHLFFLGYPDGGLLHLLLEKGAAPFRSRYTRKAAVPYPEALSPGAAYTSENLERDLGRVLNRVRPTVVLAPSPLDAHPDHRAAGLLAMRLLGRPGEKVRLRFWIVHGGFEWPLPKGHHPSLPLAPPPRGRSLPWQRVDLSEADESFKRRAIEAHLSQVAVLGRYMAAFERRNELLSPTPLPTPGLLPLTGLSRP